MAQSFDSLKKALDRAEHVAQRECEIRYVVYESGEYHVCDDVDLDTWFAGLRDEQIIYCTADGEL
jgi:hypothetical protein